MSRRYSASLFVALWLVFAVAAVSAQDAKVQASLSVNQAVWVGQEVSLMVELYAPGYFASAVSFDLPDPDGVLLMPPAGHPVVTTKTIDGVRYSVQQHELRAWAMREGRQSIPALNARFSFKRQPLDTQEVAASLTSEPIPFQVNLPPGTENLGTVISARNLKVEETWQPEPGTEEIIAGSAFTRTITYTAPDVPGMLFPPFPADQIDGLGVYAKRELLDKDSRGVLVGERRDRITYLCQRPGQFTVPATQFTWFDLDSRQLRTMELPARTLNVVANPDMASAGSAQLPADAMGGTWNWRVWVGIAVLLVLLVLLCLNHRVRDTAVRLVAPLRPVHLQPLNPPGKPGRDSR